MRSYEPLTVTAGKRVNVVFHAKNAACRRHLNSAPGGADKLPEVIHGMMNRVEIVRGFSAPLARYARAQSQRRARGQRDHMTLMAEGSR